MELADVDQPIDASLETTAAFVGRALRGPLDSAMLVRNFGEFRCRFGDCWQRSALGPAVRDFFEHGGRRLYVVRVANNARGAMLCLPAAGSALILRALEPGSTERLRAAIDYDGFDEADVERFNLTIQRVDPASGRVVDQEIFRGLSCRAESGDFVVDRLLASQLLRAAEPWPSRRPEPTLVGGNRFAPDWVVPAQAGTDGNELSDYDLVGSRTRGTGLFALDAVEKLDLVYLPPRGREADNGPAAMLAAEMYCRQRGALLIVDPRADWRSGAEAVKGLRAQGLASANAMTYFPRLAPERGEAVGRVAGGALAGLLCRQDRRHGPGPGDDGIELKRSMLPALALTETDAARLARAGINAIVQDDAGRVRLTGDCTLAIGQRAVPAAEPARRAPPVPAHHQRHRSRDALERFCHAGRELRRPGLRTDYRLPAATACNGRHRKRGLRRALQSGYHQRRHGARHHAAAGVSSARLPDTAVVHRRAIASRLPRQRECVHAARRGLRLNPAPPTICYSSPFRGQGNRSMSRHGTAATRGRR